MNPYIDQEMPLDLEDEAREEEADLADRENDERKLESLRDAAVPYVPTPPTQPQRVTGSTTVGAGAL